MDEIVFELFAGERRVGVLRVERDRAGGMGAARWTLEPSGSAAALSGKTVMFSNQDGGVFLPELSHELEVVAEPSDMATRHLAWQIKHELDESGGRLHAVVHEVEPERYPRAATCDQDQWICDVIAQGGCIAVTVYFTGGTSWLAKKGARGIIRWFQRRGTKVDLRTKAGKALEGRLQRTLKAALDITDYLSCDYWVEEICNKVSGGGEESGQDDGECYGEIEVAEGDADEIEEWFDVDEQHECCDESCDDLVEDGCPPDENCWEECYWQDWGTCGQCEATCGQSGCWEGCNYGSGSCYEDDTGWGNGGGEQCWEDCYWGQWDTCGSCESQCGFSGCWSGCDDWSGNCWEDAYAY